MGQSPPSSTYNTQGIGLPFFQGKADFGYINPSPRVWCSEPTRTGQAGDILMSVRAPVGDVNLATETCALGRGVAAIRAAAQSNSIFLYYALQFYKPQLVAASSGAIFESINKATLHDLEIHLPSKPEQEKIAAILWKLQQAIATQDKLLKATADLKQSAMQRLFTHGLRGEPIKETEIGPMPESWSIARLDACCDVLSSRLSYTDLAASESTDAEQAVSVHGVKVSDMNLPGNELRFETANLIRTMKRELAERKAIPEDTVVFPKRGAAIATNKKRLTTRRTVLDPNLIGVRARKGLDKSYLFQWFEQFDLRTITEPGPTPQLNKKNLVPLLLPIPETEAEQRDIAAALSTIDRKHAHHRRKRAALDALFQTILHQLMTGQVRVADLDIDTSEVATPAEAQGEAA